MKGGIYRRTNKLRLKSALSELLVALLLVGSVGAQTSSSPDWRSRKSDAHRPAANGAPRSQQQRGKGSTFWEQLRQRVKERLTTRPRIKRWEEADPGEADVTTENRAREATRPETQESQHASAQAVDPNRTIVVYSTADDGPSSLRQALREASDGNKINIVARGTITLISGELVVDKSVTIRGPGKANMAVSGNNASRVFHIMPGTTVTISGLTITNGRASGGFPTNAGAGIFSDHADLTIDRCIISSNSARSGGGVFSNSAFGGSAKLTLNDTIVSSNTARFGFGGGILNAGGFNTGPSGATLTLNDSTVSGNTAWFGGGIFNDGFSGNATATINNSAVTNNTARTNGESIAGGGGIYNNGDSGVANLTLTNSTVSGNVVGVVFEVPEGEPVPYQPGNGGGIYNDSISTLSPGNARVTLVNTTVSGNTAHGESDTGFGGGIYSEGRDLGIAKVMVDNSNISDNTADESGGGISSTCFSCEARITLTGSVVNGNTARVSAGIESLSVSSESYPDIPGKAFLTLANTVVRGNSSVNHAIQQSGVGGTVTMTITSSDVTDNLGGGIATGSCCVTAGRASATISDSIISRNQTPPVGGGIVNFANLGSSTLKITNSTIRENHAISGGGIANISNYLGRLTLTMDKSTVSDNRAANGAGLLNDGDSGDAFATITNSTLSGNSAHGDVSVGSEYIYGGGGGVLNGHAHNGGEGIVTLDLINCTLSGNSTQRTGGAIANHATYTRKPELLARVTLNNCTLSGNSAAQGGNSIWNKAQIDDEPCIPDPEPCTDPGPGVAKVDFANTIFNTGASGGNFQNISPGIITSRGYNLSSDAAGGDGLIGPGGFLNAIGDIRNTDPQLGPLQDNGGPTMTHALLSYSPAIDNGDPNFNPSSFNPPLLFDQRSAPEFPRVVNGSVDIGAFEWGYP